KEDKKSNIDIELYNKSNMVSMANEIMIKSNKINVHTSAVATSGVSTVNVGYGLINVYIGTGHEKEKAVYSDSKMTICMADNVQYVGNQLFSDEHVHQFRANDVDYFVVYRNRSNRYRYKNIHISYS